MGISEPNPAGSFDLGEVAPFWLPAADADGRVIHAQVEGAARELWPWAFRHVQKELHDGPRALEIVQEVAAEVSGRFEEDAEIGRNLKGYYTTAFINCVRNYVLREGRIEYEGLIRELEENYHPHAPDWIRHFETALSLKLLAAYLSAPMRRMLSYRLSDYSWKEIGVVFIMTDRQVRSRFYYGARKAYDDLLRDQAQRKQSKED